MRPSALQLITEETRRLKAVLNRTPLSQVKAAEEAGFDRSRLVEAGLVIDYAPYLREKIMSGGLSIQDAATSGRDRAPSQARSPGFFS
jgi:hypothetical protein